MRTSPPCAPLIPIFNYHTVTDDPSSGIAPFAVRPAELVRHLDLMAARHCTALTVSGLVELLDRNITPSPGTVLITFDDGYQDNLTVAAPLLAARGLPATVFATSGLLPGCPGGAVSRDQGAMIPWSRLVELEAAGIEVGSHAHSHRQLDVLSRRDAGWEIRHSKELLEEALGHRITSFAYPHGYATRWLQGEVQRCGFHGACGVRNAFSHTTDNRWLLARLVVGPETNMRPDGRFSRRRRRSHRRPTRVPANQGVAAGPTSSDFARAHAHVDRPNRVHPCLPDLRPRRSTAPYDWWTWSSADHWTTSTRFRTVSVTPPNGCSFWCGCTVTRWGRSPWLSLLRAWMRG